MPEIVDDETEQEMEETVLKTKPRLRRSITATGGQEPPQEEEEELPVVSPIKKKPPPRTEKQKAALAKGREISREKAMERKKKKAEITLGLNDPPVEENSVTMPMPTRHPESIAKRSIEPPKNIESGDNGWKAFAEFLVRDREPKERKEIKPKEVPDKPPPPPPQGQKSPPPASAERGTEKSEGFSRKSPPQNLPPVQKKIAFFS